MFGSDYINLALNKLRNKIEIIEKNVVGWQYLIIDFSMNCESRLC